MYRRVIQRRYRNKRYKWLLGVLALLILLSLYLTQFYRKHEIRAREKSFDELVGNAAARHALDPCFVKAVIWQESRFDPNVVGSSGEIGLMQITDGAVEDWARFHGKKAPYRGLLFIPDVNTEIGTWYLARALRRWSVYTNCHHELALCEYNAGLTAAKKWAPANRNFSGDIYPRIGYNSTRHYVRSVMDQYLEYASWRQAE